jgi:putative peptidoglycan lipid II flippase
VDDNEHREREHFFGAAKVVAGITVLSRVLGMLREMAIVWLGARWQNDAFQFAFAIPNLFRRLFGEGALSAAFVPVFTETAETSSHDRASRLLANALGLLAVFLLGLMILIQAGLLAWELALGGRPDRRLLVTLASIMLPFMVTVCLLALGSAALNCRGHFAYPAAAPIVLNVCVIAGAWLVAPYWRGDRAAQLTVIAASVALAGVLQLGGVLWLLRRSGLSIRPRLRPVEPGVKRMLKLMGPMIVGMGFLQLSSLFDYLVQWLFAARQSLTTVNLFGATLSRPLSEGVVVRVAAAQRLYQFPMGVLAISLGVAVFPLLSRYASRGNIAGLRDSLNRALRIAFMEGLATGTGLFLLAEPIMKLVYRHGDFSAADAENAAFILRMYVLGMWAYCTYQIVLRAFYSLKDAMTPVKVSCALAVLYMGIVFSLIWVPFLGEGAFGVAPAITFSVNVVVLAALLRRRLGRIGGRRLLASASRSVLCCLVMAAVVELLKRSLAGGGSAVVVTACVPAGAAAFLLTARIIRAAELNELIGSLRKQPQNHGESAPSETI